MKDKSNPYFSGLLVIVLTIAIIAIAIAYIQYNAPSNIQKGKPQIVPVQTQEGNSEEIDIYDPAMEEKEAKQFNNPTL